MRCIHVIEATVDPGRMEDFIRTVQIWERDALAHPDGPEHHTVLIDSDEPSQVVLISQFEDEERWRRFSGAELLGRLGGRRHLLSGADDQPEPARLLRRRDDRPPPGEPPR